MTGLALMFVLSLTAEPDLCPLVRRLNAVIIDATDHNPPSCPRIGFSALPTTGSPRAQAGAYFPTTGAIELAPDLDLTTPLGQSYLLHELVHAAQFASGADRHARCPALLEAEAYRVQADFLRQAGLPRDAVLISLLAMHLGACDTEY